MNSKIVMLLVEDNPADAYLTAENLKTSKILHELHTVETGEAALAFLRRTGEYADAPRPDLVFLDLNLPGMHGRDVLQEVKTDPDLKSIPVVVLTSSQAEQDVVKAYTLMANAYIKKPVDLDGFGKVVQGIEGFWFSVVVYPPNHNK